MPGKIDGIEASQKISAKQDIPIIFLTACMDDPIIESVASSQPYGYILIKSLVKFANPTAAILFGRKAEQLVGDTFGFPAVEERTEEISISNEQLRLEINERKRTEEALRKSEAHYALAQRAAGIATWDWNILTGGIDWSE